MQKFVQQQPSLDSAFLEEISPNFTDFDLHDDVKDVKIEVSTVQVD